MAAWYSQSWLYRIPVPITNGNSTSNLSYCQVGISLTGAAYTSFHAHALSTGADLFVTDSDGVTPLSFALEAIDTTNSAVYILVKVSVPANTTKTIYCYYGNAGASSASSYANTVGNVTALVGPTSILAQGSYPNYNSNPQLVVLKNQGGVNGGGATLNGNILVISTTGATSNAGPNSSVTLSTSTNGGTSWTSALLLAPASSSYVYVRSFVELADGTLLFVYDCDTNTINAAGTAPYYYIAKSVNGGSTWSNLSSTPSNPLVGPWTTHTNNDGPYGQIVQNSSTGDLYMPAYGNLTGETTGWHCWILKCSSGSDPTNGSNWGNGTAFSTIAYDGTLRYAEPFLLQLTSTNYLCVMRNETGSGNGDLYIVSTTNTGTTWTSPARLNIPNTSATPNNAVSPWMILFPDGCILLLWGLRYGNEYGFAMCMSTDGGATWDDREILLMGTTASSGQTAIDFGYPSAGQLSNGNVVVAYYFEVGSTASTTDVSCFVFNEDYVANANNTYDSCNATSSFTSIGAQCTASTTETHNAAHSLKFDNSAGTAAHATRAAWNSDASAPAKKIAWSQWIYPAQIAAGEAVEFSALDGSGNYRVDLYLYAADWQWYDTGFESTGYAYTLNQWAKYTCYANCESSTAGALAANNVVKTTSLAQYQSGSYPQTVKYFTGTSGSDTNTADYLADWYTHQYTPNVPTFTLATEQIYGAGTIYAPGSSIHHPHARPPVSGPQFASLYW